MKTEIKIDESKNTAYLLFGWEAIEARPNLDPFQSSLRTIDETGQVYTSDVHLKHHARRGIKAAYDLDHKATGAKPGEIFYEKKDSTGKSRSLITRVLDLKAGSAEDIFNTCLDLPLFGFVYAKPGKEKGLPGESYQKNGATNTILRPTTFHEAKITFLGRNNAFTQKGDDGEDKEASGSAVTDVLDYGFFLALFEISIPALKENIEKHIHAPKDVNAWISLLADGLWRAYTTHRYASITQRGQYANFALAWSPEDPGAIKPTTLREIAFRDEEITNAIQAKKALKTILPSFLKDWQYSQETEAGRIDPKNTLDILNQE